MMRTKTIGMSILVTIFLASTASCATAEEIEVPEPGRIAPSNTVFALELYDELSSRPGNLFFSPFSISAALAMTYAGARSQTAVEMASALHFDLEPVALHKTFGQLLYEINAAGKEGDFELHTANSLWCQKDYNFLKEFVEITKENYKSAVYKADFVGAVEKARVAINSWVEEKTSGKIADLIKPGTLDPSTVLVLVNAIYFKGDWALQFDEKKTIEEPFVVAPDKTIYVDMMHQKAPFRYSDFGQFSAIELPYSGEDLSMLILLPAEMDGLNDLEEELDAAELEDVIKRLASVPPEDVNVSLPKFKMTSEFQLAKTLAKMGMPAAFTPGEADFSGMDGSKSLFIGQVVHKAFVDVNEEGTEAAAATSVHILKASVSIVPDFRADHPFLFMVRHNHSGSILFMGRVVDPRA
jgi:serpin B